MALETISKILSPTNATYINGVSAERRFAAAVLDNAYQGLVEKDGVGVNDSFVTEDDAQSAAQVFVNRILPVKIKPREQGANKNGASFSANKHYNQTETVGIEILTVLDDPIIIPRARQDMIKVDLLAEQTKIFSDRLKTILNGATAASKLVATFVAKAAGEPVNEQTITATDVTNKVVLDKFIEANSKLDEGDTRHGIDIFPEDTRVAVFKVSYRATLKTSGILIIGGANAAYEIAKGSAVSTGDSARRSEDGYIGEIDGVPCHLISNESLAHASEFLGFPSNELKDSDFIGYISSSYANARGVSTTKQTKIVDAVDGQGIILQPYVKFGCVAWYPLGNVILSKSELDPVTELKTIFSGVASQLIFKLKGAGSRLFPTLGATQVTIASDGVTVANTVTALDDWDTDHFKGAAFVVSDSEITTVNGFLAAYSAATYKGTITALGSKESTTVGDNKWVTVIAIADDGSVSLVSKKKA